MAKGKKKKIQQAEVIDRYGKAWLNKDGFAVLRSFMKLHFAFEGVDVDALRIIEAKKEFNYVRENASLFVDKNYMFDAIYRVEVNGKWVKVLVGIKDIEKKPTIAWMTAYACYMFLYDIENIIRRKGYDSLNGFGPDDFVECFVMIVLNMSGEDWGSYVDVSDIYDNRDVSERESIPIKVINLGHLLDKERDVLDSEVLLADEILREMQKFGKLEIVLEKYKDEMEKVSPELFAVLMNMPGFAGKAKKEH